MFQRALILGGAAGFVIIVSMIIGLSMKDESGFFSSQWFGYLTMLIALSIIFIGMKQYRDDRLGGVITFKQGAIFGLMIAASAGAIYVVVWEGYLAATDFSFVRDYSESVLEAKRAKGITGDALAKEVQRMEQFKTQYMNPLFRVPVTFSEIFPIGAIIALISAALLRNSKFLAKKR